MKILRECKCENITLPENMCEVFSWKTKRRIFITSNVLSSISFAIFTAINLNYFKDFLHMHSIFGIIIFIFSFLLFIFIYVILHELVHFIAYPGNPFSNDKKLIIGKYAISAYFEGYISFYRKLYVLALPILLLSIAFIIIHYYLIGEKNVVFNLLFLTHIVLCSADVIVFVLYLILKPRNVMYYGNYYLNN
ncbi:MAG: DUF3267 domain-containing protein [Candidatus Omnitrophica bacterium]|nr:DUF3267 domain-containing protein [Candidatus Omnitrophota bacterium]